MRNLAKRKLVFRIASYERRSVFLMKTLSKVSGVGIEGTCLQHLLHQRHENFLGRAFISARFGEVTDPKGNSEFCFPEILSVPRGKAEGNTEVDYEGKQN